MDAAQLKVTLRWKEGCDLDLMVFYRLHQPGTDKDGAPLGDAQAPRAGWILSTNYSVGMGGMLTEPPYIGLTEDAGGTRRGDYQEELRFFRLDLLEEFHVYVVNYTAARQETSSFAQHRFSDENTTVEIVTTDARLLGGGDRRLRFPLIASGAGSTVELVRWRRATSSQAASALEVHTTPGELRPTRLLDAFRAREGSHFSVNEIYAKRELETPASEQRLPPSVYEVALVWDGPQDLDLHALVRMEDPYRGEKGRGTPLSGDARERHVFWRDQGRLDGFPFAKLGGDDGVEEDPGPKEESIRFDAARLDRALFFVQHSGSSTSIEGLGSLRMLFRGPHIEGSSDLETRFEVDLLHGLDPKGSMRWCQGLAVDCSERGKVSVRAMARTCDGMPRLDATPSQPPTPPAPSEQQRLRQLFFGRERHLFKELDWLLEATKEAAPADAPSQERPDFSCARRLVGHRTECEEGEQVYSENRTRLARVFGHCCDQLGLPREQVKLFTCHLSTTDCLATANTHSLSERGSVYQVCIPEQIVGCLDDGELAFLLGHELGHVMLEHPSWDIHGRNVKVRFPDLADIEENTWQRHLAAEITADRMGLLCCEDLHAAFAMLWRLEQMKPGQTFAEHRQLWAQEGKNQKSALQNLRVMFHGRSLSEHWQKIREDLQRTPRKLPTHPPPAIRFRALELAALDVLAFASDAEHFDWRAFRAIDKKISEMWQV